MADASQIAPRPAPLNAAIAGRFESRGGLGVGILRGHRATRVQLLGAALALTGAVLLGASTG